MIFLNTFLISKVQKTWDRDNLKKLDHPTNLKEMCLLFNLKLENAQSSRCRLQDYKKLGAWRVKLVYVGMFSLTID
jgi:hypothetical protein